LSNSRGINYVDTTLLCICHKQEKQNFLDVDAILLKMKILMDNLNLIQVNLSTSKTEVLRYAYI